VSEDYVVIFGAAVAGAFWCLAGAHTGSHWEAIKLLARTTAVVTGLGYLGGFLMNKYIGLIFPWDVATAAFIIGATSEHHPTLLEELVKRLKRMWK
jgi:hypothetical protein